MSNLLRFLKDVQWVAGMRLTQECQMHRAITVPVMIGPYSDYASKEDLMMRDIIGRGDYAPLGESYFKDGPGHVPEKIVMYSDGIPNVKDYLLEKSIPYGRILAFVMIHEMAHCAVMASGHEDAKWLKACTDMGIKENYYSLKKREETGLYKFADDKLWSAIQRMRFYPGDEYPEVMK